MKWKDAQALHDAGHCPWHGSQVWWEVCRLFPKRYMLFQIDNLQIQIQFADLLKKSPVFDFLEAHFKVHNEIIIQLVRSLLVSVGQCLL